MVAAGKPNAGIHQNNFGSLRIVFALLVIVGHSPELIDGDRSRELLTAIFGTISFGEFAVDGFFLLSGYLITKSFQNSRSVADYLIKRILRIYPGFLVAFLVSTLIVGPLAGGNLWETPVAKVLGKMALLGTPIATGAFAGLPYPVLNGSLWTIPYEFRCYLLVVVAGALATRANRTGYAVLLAGLLALYSVRAYLPESPGADAIVGNLAVSARLTFVFFVGGAFYVWRDMIALTPRRALVAAVMLLPLMGVPPLAEPALAILGGYLLFWYAFACRANVISRAMDRADPSYGVYLYAWPIQNLLVYHFTGLSPWTVTAITIPSAVALGFLSWFVCEKPAMQYKTLFARRARAS